MGTWFECGLRLPKALRAWFECCTLFEDTRFECGEPNQPRDNITPIHTLWTIVARGSRTRGSNVAFGSLRPFGPGSNVARGSKRTQLPRFAAPVYLTNQEIMSHPYIHFGTIVARGWRTRGSNVAFGYLRPFGPGSNVARGSTTR